MSEESDRHLAGLLNFDPLFNAEEITGKELGDEGTGALGFVLMHERANQLTAELRESDDTYRGTEAKRFFRIAAEEGFEFILENSHDKYPEYKTAVFFKRDEGLFLTATHNFSNKGEVDTATLHANWEPATPPNESTRQARMHMSWSAHPREDVLVGAISVRVEDGLRYHLRLLRDGGKFWPDWIKALSLDITGKERAKSSQRIEALRELPPDIQQQIAPAFAVEKEYGEFGL